MEGIGILLLIPMLEQLGISEQAGTTSRLSLLFEETGLPRTLPVILAIYIGLVSGRAFLVRWLSLHNSRIHQDFVVTLSTRIFGRITRAGWTFFTRNRSSHLTSVLSSDVNRVGDGVHFLLQMSGTVLITFIYILIALRLSAPVSLISFVCASLLFGLLAPTRRDSRQCGSELTRMVRGFFDVISEQLSGMKVVKGYAAETRHEETYRNVMGSMRGQMLTFVGLQTGARMWFEVGGVLILCTVLLLAVYVFHIPIAELLLLIFIYARLLPKFSQIQRDYLQITHLLPAWRSVRELEEACLRETTDRMEAAPAPLLQNEIVFDQVSFAYVPERTALRKVDLRVPVHKTTAIVGASGAGKSTVADLLLGLLLPTGGSIRVDDVDLQEKHLASWRGTIGYVPQETFLFHDTIRANLIWSRPGASEAQIEDALSLAAASDFVHALPEGIHTRVGDRGVALSGGERQRLALARALLRQPELLILDEATSSLDGANELKIQQAIDQLHGNMTIVWISHRLTTIRSADHIIVLDEGEVVEQGPREALLALPDGRFRMMLANAGDRH